MVELSIAIPFYNESTNSPLLIDKIIENLDSSKISYEIIAVDNGSVDDTGAILEGLAKTNPKIRIVTVKKNIGYGYGVMQGLAACKGDFVGYMWADDFAGAKILPDLVEALRKNDIGLSKVTRLQRNEGVFRKVQSWTYNSLFGSMFGLKSRDINGCPKIMKKSFYDSLDLESKDWFLDPEIMIKLRKSNHGFLEIPHVFEKRKFEKSHVRFYTCLEFLKNMKKYKKRGF